MDKTETIINSIGSKSHKELATSNGSAAVKASQHRDL